MQASALINLNISSGLSFIAMAFPLLCMDVSTCIPGHAISVSVTSWRYYHHLSAWWYSWFHWRIILCMQDAACNMYYCTVGPSLCRDSIECWLLTRCYSVACLRFQSTIWYPPQKILIFNCCYLLGRWIQCMNDCMTSLYFRRRMYRFFIYSKHEYLVAEEM